MDDLESDIVAETVGSKSYDLALIFKPESRVKFKRKITLSYDYYIVIGVFLT